MPRTLCFLLLAGTLVWVSGPLARADDPPTSTVPDVQSFGCDQGTASWRVVDPLGGGRQAPAGSSLRVVTAAAEHRSGRGALRLSYRRERTAVAVLFNPFAELTQLERLVFWARTRQDALLRLVTTDRDGAQLFRPFKLRAGRWTEVVVRPGEFQVGKDSPVRKAAVDAGRLGAGFGLVDLAGPLGQTGGNDLWIDDVRIERRPIQRSTGRWVIGRGRTVVIDADRFHDGPIEVQGRLEIRTSRFNLGGNLIVDGGEVLIDGPVLRLPQRYRFEFKLIARNKSSVTLSRAAIQSVFPVALEAESGATFQLSGLRMLLGGLHGEVRKGCRFVVDRVVHAGEFVLAPGGDLRVERSNTVLVWFSIMPGQKTTLSLPDGAHLVRWALPAMNQMKLNIRESRHVMWGLITTHDSDLTVKGSQLRAVGLAFVNRASVSVKGLRNRTRYAEEAIQISDRKMKLIETTVAAWNFYPMQDARLSVQDCVFGEAMVFNHATLEVHGSTCDGSGGFLGVLDDARVKMVGCTLTCDVNAYGRGEALLERCGIQGNVTAADSSRIRLVETPVDGRQLTFGSGKIE